LGDFEETWALDDNFLAIGYEGRLVIPNLGAVFLVIVLQGILFVILGTLWLSSKVYKNSAVEVVRSRLYNQLVWNATLTLFIEASLELSLAVFINMDYIYWDQFDVFMCSLFTHVFIIALLVLNAFMLTGYIRKDTEELESEEF